MAEVGYLAEIGEAVDRLRFSPAPWQRAVGDVLAAAVDRELIYLAALASGGVDTSRAVPEVGDEIYLAWSIARVSLGRPLPGASGG